MEMPVESLNVAASAAVIITPRGGTPDEQRVCSTTIRTIVEGGTFQVRLRAKGTPLAERMRPHTLDEVVGQDEILAPGKPLPRGDRARVLLQSILLWGPPGTGKTTLARIIAGDDEGTVLSPSARSSRASKRSKEVMAAAQVRRRSSGRRTIVFVDEIHRFNKAQQDASCRVSNPATSS